MAGTAVAQNCQMHFASCLGGAVIMDNDIHYQFAVPSDTSHLAKLRRVIVEVLGNASFAPPQAHLIALAVDEAVANIMEHGQACGLGQTEPRSGDILVLVDLSAERLAITIRDKGACFDPRGVPEVDLAEHIRTGQRSGLGVYLIRRIMDEVNYTTRENSENELQLVKYVDDDAEMARSNRSCL